MAFLSFIYLYIYDFLYEFFLVAHDVISSYKYCHLTVCGNTSLLGEARKVSE